MICRDRLAFGKFLLCAFPLIIINGNIKNISAFSPSNKIGRYAYAAYLCRQRRGPLQLRTSYRNDDIGDAGTHRPIPAMPSKLFQDLAMSQLELLANSLRRPPSSDTKDSSSNAEDDASNNSKIKSMALYLPQENVNTGQLEFLPVVIYPHPSTERVFIASDANSKLAPALPKTLTKLPGFTAPNSLLPRYPMVSTEKSSENFAAVGVVEEVMCDIQSGAPALSVPLFMGSQTVGVLLVSPAITSTAGANQGTKASVQNGKRANGENIWTDSDREQITRAARTLSMALNMDTERKDLEIQNNRIKDSLSDSLHQIKNPLQALRTFGKLLQQRVASVGEDGVIQKQVEFGTTLQLLELTQNLMVQSDRVVNLLTPMDALVESMGDDNQQRYLNAATPLVDSKHQSIVPWDQANPPSLPWESDTIEFARREANQTNSVPFPSPSPVFPTTKSKSADKKAHNGTIEFSRDRPAQQGGTKSSRNAASSSELFTTREKPQRKKQVRSKDPKAQASPPREVPASSTVIGGDDEEEMAFVLDVLEPILSLYKAIGEERGISLEFLGLELADELPGVIIRRKALQEAVSNLLDNAFKYGSLPNEEGNSSNPKPCVRVRLMPNNPREIPAGCTLVIEDNGPGVPPDEAAVIFERGFRSPTTSKLAEGSGIGLAISRRLLESMGGTLECLVRNKGGRGTETLLSPKLLNGAVFRISLFRNRSEVAVDK